MTRREWCDWLMWLSSTAAATRVAAAAPPPADAPRDPRPDAPTPALTRFHVVADDFVVDMWHNGEPLPDACRELSAEIHGATVEKVTRAVRPGDWLAFHVVNNRLRWGGVKYFGFVGFAAGGDPTLVSEADASRWSSCEDPAEVRRFLARPETPVDRPVVAIAARWDRGDPTMAELSGGHWAGTPIWGAGARSVWLKLRVPQ